ncbi:hypothetical protein JW898_02215 [Candidatus Woesearchaeota archaeon]|nr:hypothetical protein [Candidatus Woesearchaeota archaeon]
MFLIYLLIMPVLHSANVFAEFFSGISGYDRVAGFRRATEDVTIINASAFLGGETVEASQVKLITDPTRRFECSEPNVTGQVSCEMIIPGDLPPGPKLYEVQLFHADMTEAAPKIPLIIYVDNLPPTIHSFGLMRNGSDVLAGFQVSDKACEECSPEVCAGIKSVDFFLNYVDVGSFLPENHTCLVVMNGTKLEIAPAQGTSTKTICIEVNDNLNQKSSLCREIVMDFSPPQLINASLWLSNSPLKYNNGEPIENVQLKAYFFEESELNMSSIVADFSALNARPEFSGFYKNIDMNRARAEPFRVNCSNISKDTYVCTWSGLLVLLPSAATPDIKISASDNLSNVMNDSYTIPIIFDNTKPLISSIRSGIADERGRYWVGTGNNTIFADIREEDSGFYDKKLFLDFASFGPQPFAGNKVVLAPNNCSEGWTCVYELVNVKKGPASGSLIPVSVAIGSIDDANNAVEGVTSTGFYYDAEAPQIIGIQNSSICPTAPDSIDITINVSERYSGGVRAEVSAPDLSTNVFPQSFDCEETDLAGIWTCDITIDNLVTFYVDGEINVTLIDRAGNRNTTTLKQEVCEAAPGTPPNVVKTVSSVNLFPNTGLDRKVAGVTAFPLFWQPNPKFDAGSGSIQDIKIDGCTIEGGEVSGAYMITPLNMEDPVFGMKVSLSEGLSVENVSEMKDSAVVECKLSMIVRAGTKVYQEPETEIVSFGVPLYDTLFGEMNSTMRRKMQDIEDLIKNKESDIDSLQSWIDFAGWYCSVSEFVMKLMMVLQVLKVVLYALGWIVYGIARAFGSANPDQAGGNVYYLPCLIADYLTTTFITNLWQVNSLPNTALTSPGYYNKLLCSAFTCRFTETTNFIELIGHLGRTDGGSFSGSVDGVNREGERNALSREDINPELDKGDIWLTVLWAGDNRFSAYRSYPIAKRTLCGPAQLYGLKKERQVLCMYRNCYRDLVAAGFSPEICDRMYAGRECLYVDGAAYRLVDDADWNKLFAGLFEWMMNQLAATGISIGLVSGNCGYPTGLDDVSNTYNDIQDNCGSSADLALNHGWRALVCGIGVMSAMWIDLGDWMDWDDFRNMYDRSLGDPDFCSM